MSWLRRIRCSSRREKDINEKPREELELKKQWLKRSRKGDFCGLDMWSSWRGKTTNRSFIWTCGGKEKQREAEEDLDGQCRGRPEGEKHRLNHDW